MPLELNYEQLCEEGYISGLEGEDIFPAWENGVLFTITETDDPVTFNLPSLSEGGELPSMTQYNIKNTVSFDASKWRTALGAYGFSECVAAQDNERRVGRLPHQRPRVDQLNEAHIAKQRLPSGRCCSFYTDFTKER